MDLDPEKKNSEKKPDPDLTINQKNPPDPTSKKNPKPDPTHEIKTWSDWLAVLLNGMLDIQARIMAKRPVIERHLCLRIHLLFGRRAHCNLRLKKVITKE